MANRFLTRKQVEGIVNLSTSSLYRLMRRDAFPIPVRVGQRAVRWSEDEVIEWLATRPRATGDFPRE